MNIYIDMIIRITLITLFIITRIINNPEYVYVYVYRVSDFAEDWRDTFEYLARQRVTLITLYSPNNPSNPNNPNRIPVPRSPMGIPNNHLNLR